MSGSVRTNFIPIITLRLKKFYCKTGVWQRSMASREKRIRIPHLHCRRTNNQTQARRKTSSQRINNQTQASIHK